MLTKNGRRGLGLFKNNKFHFSSTLYIPSKKLCFTKHPKHGRVYPVYLACEEKKTFDKYSFFIPVLVGFSLFNTIIGLTAFNFISNNPIYGITDGNFVYIALSFGINYYLIGKYLAKSNEYRTRIKNMFLLPNGKEVILETFSEETFKLNIFDIYESRTRSKYEEALNNLKENKKIKIPLLVDNANSFVSYIEWGRVRKHVFQGNRKFLDFEIFDQIVNRTHIDTMQSRIENLDKYKHTIWTLKEKKSLLNFYQKHKKHLIYYKPYSLNLKEYFIRQRIKYKKPHSLT
jgi:hypothetical protein